MTAGPETFDLDQLEAMRKWALRQEDSPKKRRESLASVRRLLLENESAILETLQADLGKERVEAYAAEIGTVLAEIRVASRSLKSWMKPRRVSVPLHFQPGSGSTVPCPLGVILIIGAYNYPLQLSLAPLVGALAAGNAAVIKPSELCSRVEALLVELVPKYFTPHQVRVVSGGREVGEALVALPFDKIVFTGSRGVGRAVLRSAAENLTPVILELGGRNPCLITERADLDVAVKRIFGGKLLAAGQTCVAPETVLVPANMKDAFVEAFKNERTRALGDEPLKSVALGKQVSPAHFARQLELLESAEVLYGGEYDEESRKMAPTLIVEKENESEESFGPILSVRTYGDLKEGIERVSGYKDPLAVYVFTDSSKEARLVESQCQSGAFCVNEVAIHVAMPGLPFGGVGQSGYGRYHGVHGFDAFSNLRAVLRRPTFLDFALRYAPYSKRAEKMFRFFMGRA